MTENKKQPLNEQQFYQMLDKYYADRKNSALTTVDSQTFIGKKPAYLIEPERVIKHIILGDSAEETVESIEDIIKTVERFRPSRPKHSHT